MKFYSYRLNRQTTTVVLLLSIVALLSCNNDVPVTDKTTPTVLTTIDSTTIGSKTIQPEEVESRYHFDQDWEIFKTAVLTKDIKGVAAFAGSDEIDSEALLQSLSDPDILKKLESTTYSELTSETQGEFIYLVFSAEISGSDGDGNEYESGIYLYFSQGETSLILDYYLAAG